VHFDRKVKDLLEEMGDTDRRERARSEIVDVLGVDILESLSSLLADADWCSRNLTKAYHAIRVSHTIQEQLCMKRFQELLQDPRIRNPSDLSFPLEDGAIIIAQAEYPFLHSDAIHQQLNDMARAFVQRHPEYLSMTRVQAMTHLCSFMFGSFGEDFGGNTEDYNSPDNSMINQVLRTRRGIPITLSLVLSAICRRLGLPLLMVGAPGHFLTKFETGEQGRREVFIDAFNRGSFLSRQDWLMSFGEAIEMAADIDDSLEAVSPFDVYARMLRNLIRIYKRDKRNMQKLLTVLNLFLEMMPDSPQELFFRIHVHLSERNYPWVATEIERLLSEKLLANAGDNSLVNRLKERLDKAQKESVEKSSCRRRLPGSSSPRFHVGQVLYAIRDIPYSCKSYPGMIGVVFGWDPFIASNFDQKPLYNPENTIFLSRNPTAGLQPFSMGLPSLGNKRFKKGTDQPFYYLKMDRESCTQDELYVAEEHLQYCNSPQPLAVDDLGRFFTHFDGATYVPNPELRSLYPDDDPRTAFDLRHSESDPFYLGGNGPV